MKRNKLYLALLSLSFVSLCFNHKLLAYTASPVFKINTHENSSKDSPAVASNGSNYLVSWNSLYQDGSAVGIYGQLFESNGSKSGSEFLINTYTNDTQSTPAIASNGSDYLVSWHSGYPSTALGQDGSYYGVYGQIINSNGSKSGSEFRANTYVIGTQDTPSVASNGSTYLVSWNSGGIIQDGNGYGVYGQVFTSNGATLGSEFQINTHTSGDQRASSVASNGSGYLVTWQSLYQYGSVDGEGIYGQFFESDGSKSGSEFLINTYITGIQDTPSVASNGSNYLVAWQSNGSDGDAYGISGQIIGLNGDKVGSEFQINSYTTGYQYIPSVASNGSGYLVTWQSLYQDGSGWGIYGQFFDSNGLKIDNEFQINTFTTGDQYDVTVASNGSNYFVTWTGYPQEGTSYYGIYGTIITPDAQTSQPIPEPMTWVMFISSFIGVFCYRKTR